MKILFAYTCATFSEFEEPSYCEVYGYGSARCTKASASSGAAEHSKSAVPHETLLGTQGLGLA